MYNTYHEDCLITTLIIQGCCLFWMIANYVEAMNLKQPMKLGTTKRVIHTNRRTKAYQQTKLTVNSSWSHAAYPKLYLRNSSLCDNRLPPSLTSNLSKVLLNDESILPLPDNRLAFRYSHGSCLFYQGP